MKDELIFRIYKSEESYAYRSFLECRKIQNSYWKVFIKEFKVFLDWNAENCEEEQKCFIKVKEIVESEIFQYLIDNNKYYEKVNNILTKECLIVGESRESLLNIYNELSALCDNYVKEYETFVIESRKKMETEFHILDKESLHDFENILDSNICQKDFFNTLCNYKMI